MLAKIAPWLALGVLAGCGTPEYRAERGLCASEWLQKIPPAYEREIYVTTEARQVPTGRTICEKVGKKIVCDEVRKTEYFNVPAVRTVDRNKPRRDARIRQCTQAACVAKYGNAACEA